MRSLSDTLRKLVIFGRKTFISSRKFSYACENLPEKVSGRAWGLDAPSSLGTPLLGSLEERVRRTILCRDSRQWGKLNLIELNPKA